MSRRNGILKLFVLLSVAVLLLCCSAAGASGKKERNTAEPDTAVTAGPAEEAQRLADYIFEHGELPDYFLTKREAQELGWDHNYLSDVAPGMSIGGDRFGNYERKLPALKGRKYFEADCYYRGGKRNAYRIIYSNDGHVWYTEDHYETFIELFPTEKADAPPDPE